MTRAIFYAMAAGLLVAIGAASATLDCGLTNMFCITEETLKKKLADDKLTADQVSKLLKKSHTATADGELTLNGLGLDELLGLNHIKLADCDDEIVLERIDLCKKAAQPANGGDGASHFASVANYCRDRVAKLLGKCAANIEELTMEYLFDMPVRKVDIIRLIMAKHMREPKPDFKAIIDEHLSHHEYDRSTERKKSDLGGSCEHLIKAFKPIKVIMDHEEEFGIALSEGVHATEWLKAYGMCEFYLANYAQ